MTSGILLDATINHLHHDRHLRSGESKDLLRAALTGLLTAGLLESVNDQAVKRITA